MVTGKGAFEGDTVASRSGCWSCEVPVECWPDEDVDDELTAGKSCLGESEPLDVVEGGGVGAVAFTCHCRFGFAIVELGYQSGKLFKPRIREGKRTYVYRGPKEFNI